MKSREIFRLAVKIIGFIILLQGVRNLVDALLILKGYATVHLSTPRYWAAWAFVKMVAGTYLVAGGKLVVNIAFKQKAAETDTTRPAEEVEPGTADQYPTSPRIIFDLAVRTIGLILLLYGVQYIFDALLIFANTAQSRETSSHSWVVFGFGELALGIAMVRGVVPLADFAFPAEASEENPEAKESASPD